MELEFIEWLRKRLRGGPGVAIGLGDDAAVLDVPVGGQIVATVDMLTAGVDFDAATADPRLVGRKALAVNLSDLAAMASRPLAGFVALALPRQGAATLARELYEGLLPLAEQFAVPIAGGDTNSWDGPLVISVTLLGTPSAAGPLTRSGAKPGDQILVSGAFGGSLLGRHFEFEPRIELAWQLRSATHPTRRHRRQRWLVVGPGAGGTRERLWGRDRIGVDSDFAGGVFDGERRRRWPHGD